MCGRCTSEILKLLDKDDIKILRLSAKKAQSVEQRYKARMLNVLSGFTTLLIERLDNGGEMPKIDFSNIIMALMFDASKAGFEVSKSQYELHQVKLSKFPKGKLPRSLLGMIKLYDQWKNEKKLPPRQAKIAKGIKDAYLKKVQSVWEKHSEEFRKGTIVQKEEIANKIRQAGKTTFARAKTIVETETTYYYNQARREVYDELEDVTHYLFLAIRDSATTKWCRSRTGLVFTKGSKLLEKNMPPVHWNCRSEILPLTPQNPGHLKLINDKSKQAENNHLEPLPPGWGR